MGIAVREGEAGVTVIDLTGFLDTATVARLDEVIRALVAEGRRRILVNFSGLQYISSTGVGFFLGSVPEIRAKDGELRLASLPARVRRVFDTLGCAEVVPIFDTEAAAVADFAAPRAQAAAVAPAESAACPGCGTPYRLARVGIYRCRRCGGILFADPRGRVSLLRPGGGGGSKPRRVALALPADVNYLSHLRRFVSGVAVEEGFDEEKVGQIEMAFDEAVTNIIEHALNFDAGQSVEIEIVFDEHKMSAILRDAGRRFRPEESPLPDLQRHLAERKMGGLGRHLIRILMDDVVYGTTEDGRNELRLTKLRRTADQPAAAGFDRSGVAG